MDPALRRSSDADAAATAGADAGTGETAAATAAATATATATANAEPKPPGIELEAPSLLESPERRALGDIEDVASMGLRVAQDAALGSAAHALERGTAAAWFDLQSVRDSSSEHTSACPRAAARVSASDSSGTPRRSSSRTPWAKPLSAAASSGVRGAVSSVCRE